MGDAKLTVFVSHVHEDEPLADNLKGFLMSNFSDAMVFVSGRDLTGGKNWFEELRETLENATAIVAIFTRFSLSSRWVHFEAGAGFIQNRIIPIMAEGITPETLKAPMASLHARTYDKEGLKALIRDVAKLAGRPAPTAFSRLNSTVRSAREFLDFRKTILPPNQANHDNHAIEETEVQRRIRQASEGAVAMRIFAGDASFLDDDEVQRINVLRLGSNVQILMKRPTQSRLATITRCIEHGVAIRLYSRQDLSQPIRGCLVQFAEGSNTCVFNRQQGGKFRYDEIDHLGIGALFSKHFNAMFDRSVNPLVRAVIFDLAGVAFQGDITTFYDKVAKIIGRPLDTHDADYLCVDAELNLGRRDVVEWLEAKTCTTLEESHKPRIREVWRSTWSKNTPVHELALELRNMGYMTAIASNCDRENGDNYRARQLFAPFDKAFLSCEMGLLKPNVSFFTTMSEELALEPCQCIVIDDHEKNLVAARSVGMASVLVERAKKPNVKAEII